MKICGRPVSLTPTQAHFCRVMLQRRRDRLPCIHIWELAMKFGVSDTTVRNQVAGRYPKHHDFSARMQKHEARV